MMCINLCTILALFALYIVIQSPKINVVADDIFSIISDTVLERQTEYEFDNAEAIIGIDHDSNQTVCLRCKFRQYLSIVTEEMDERSQCTSRNTNKTDANLHLDTIYVDIFHEDNVRFHRVVCDASQFEKLSQENQIILANQNINSFVNRYQGTMPWLSFTGLVENDNVNYDFIFNITGPILQEEYELARNNEGKMKIKSKSEVFVFKDFVLRIMNDTKNETQTTNASSLTDSIKFIYPINGSYEYVATKTNFTGTPKSERRVRNGIEQIHAPNAKLLGTLADTWLINIVDYLNEKYVESRIFAGNEPFIKIHKMNLLDELCRNLIPNSVDVPKFEIYDKIEDIDSDYYRSYEFSQIKIDNLTKSVKCNSVDYSLKIKRRCEENDDFAEHNITFIYDYSRYETKYRSLLNWIFVKKGKEEYRRISWSPSKYEDYPDTEQRFNFEYINFIKIELSIRTKENRQPTNDSIDVRVKFDTSPIISKNITQNSYREILIPRVHDHLIEFIKSRVKF